MGSSVDYRVLVGRVERLRKGIRHRNPDEGTGGGGRVGWREKRSEGVVRYNWLNITYKKNYLENLNTKCSD